MILQTLYPREVEFTLDQYYRPAGWTNDGISTAATLKKLNLEWTVESL